MKIDEIINLTKSIIDDEIEKHPEEWKIIKEFALNLSPDEKEYFKRVMHEYNKAMRYKDMRYKTDEKNKHQLPSTKLMCDEDFYSLLKN
jgi:hypothetical protein